MFTYTIVKQICKTHKTYQLIMCMLAFSICCRKDFGIYLAYYHCGITQVFAMCKLENVYIQFIKSNFVNTENIST